MTTPNDTDAQEFINAFNDDTNEPPQGAAAGYGINPRQADSDEMAAAFNAADVSIGGPMPPREIETYELPPASGDTPATSAEPVTEIQVTEKAVDPTAQPEFKTFGQAFKWHREQAVKNGGSGTFDWNGKKFTTKLKSEVAPPKNLAAQAPIAARYRPTTVATTSPALQTASKVIENPPVAPAQTTTAQAAKGQQADGQASSIFRPWVVDSARAVGDWWEAPPKKKIGFKEIFGK